MIAFLLCLYLLGAVALLILCAACIDWLLWEWRDRQKRREYEALLAHDWPTPDYEEIR